MVTLPATAFWRMIVDRRRWLWSLASLLASPNLGSLWHCLEEGWECHYSAISSKRDTVMVSFPVRRCHPSAVLAWLLQAFQISGVLHSGADQKCHFQALLQAFLRRRSQRRWGSELKTSFGIISNRRRRFGVVPNRQRRFSAADDTAAGNLGSFGAAMDTYIHIYIYIYIYINSSNPCRWD